MGDFYYPAKNEDGVYEWILKDKFGNDIYCYYNGYTELDGFVVNAGKNIVNRI